MKITVELTDAELREVCQVTGQDKKGPAIRQLLTEALQLRKRAEVAQKFLSGTWSIDTKGVTLARKKDRAASQTLSKQWRD
jgi:5S rRNA maturation endonuclease (ribonuclease M5)